MILRSCETPALLPSTIPPKLPLPSCPAAHTWNFVIPWLPVPKMSFSLHRHWNSLKITSIPCQQCLGKCAKSFIQGPLSTPNHSSVCPRPCPAGNAIQSHWSHGCSFRLIWHIGTTWLFPKHLGRLKCIDCSTRRGTGSAKLTPGNTPRTQPLRMSLSFRRRHFLLCWRVDCSHPGWYNVLGDKDPVWHQPAQQAPRWSDSTASPLLHLTTLACPGVHHLLFRSCFQNPVSSVSSDLVICSSGFISTNGAHTKLEKNSSNTLNSDNSIGWCIICLAGGKGGGNYNIYKNVFDTKKGNVK